VRALFPSSTLIVALDDVSMQEAGVDKHRAENGAALGSEGDEEDGASDEEGKAGQEWLDSFYRSPHLSQFLPFTSNHFSYDVCECMYIYIHLMYCLGISISSCILSASLHHHVLTLSQGYTWSEQQNQCRHQVEDAAGVAA
jgi:hypothetical protein